MEENDIIDEYEHEIKQKFQTVFPFNPEREKFIMSPQELQVDVKLRDEITHTPEIIVHGKSKSKKKPKSPPTPLW